MAVFDPKKQRDNQQNQGIPAGDYLLAIKTFERKTSKAGNKYLHCRVIVIAGPAKKRSFFDNISLDLSNSGAMFRLSMLCEQCGVEQAFDLDDDDAIEVNLVGAPFKARVSRKIEGDYVNNGIERYLGKSITDADRAAMEAWVAEQAEEGQWSGRDDDAPPPGDDDAPRGRAAQDDPFGSYGGGSTRSAAPDDDIPF